MASPNAASSVEMLAQFLMELMLCTDNSRRTELEAQFSSLKRDNAAFLLEGLVQIIESAQMSLELRCFACVIFRRVLISQESAWESLPPPKAARVKSGLLRVLEQDAQPELRFVRAPPAPPRSPRPSSKLSHGISLLASVLLPAEQWPELLPTLLSFLNSPDANLVQETLSACPPPSHPRP